MDIIKCFWKKAYNNRSKPLLNQYKYKQSNTPIYTFFIDSINIALKYLINKNILMHFIIFLVNLILDIKRSIIK